MSTWTTAKGNGRVIVHAATGEKIAVVQPTPANPPVAWETAKLMAAAPAMREALIAISEFWYGQRPGVLNPSALINGHAEDLPIKEVVNRALNLAKYGSETP